MKLKLTAQKEAIACNNELLTNLSKLADNASNKGETKRALIQTLKAHYISPGKPANKKDINFLEKKLSAVFLPFLSPSGKKNYWQKLNYTCDSLSVFNVQELRTYSPKKILAFFSREFFEELPIDSLLSKRSIRKIEQQKAGRNSLPFKKLLFLYSFDDQKLNSLFFRFASSLIENPGFSFSIKEHSVFLIDMLPEISARLENENNNSFRTQLTRLIFSALRDAELLEDLTSFDNSFSLTNLVNNSLNIFGLLNAISDDYSKNLEAKFSLLTDYLASDLKNLVSSSGVFEEAPYLNLIKTIQNISHYNQHAGKENIHLAFFGEILKARNFDNRSFSDWETINDLGRLSATINNETPSYNIERSIPHLLLFSVAVNLLSPKEIKKEFNINYYSLRSLNSLINKQVLLILEKAKNPKKTSEAYIKLMKIVIRKNIVFEDLRFFEVISRVLEQDPKNSAHILLILAEILKNPTLDRSDLVVIASEDFLDVLSLGLSSLFQEYSGYQTPYLENIFLEYIKSYNTVSGYFNDLQQNLNEMISELLLSDKKAALQSLDLFSKAIINSSAFLSMNKNLTAELQTGLFNLSKILLSSHLALSPYYENSIIHTISEKIFLDYLPSQLPYSTTRRLQEGSFEFLLYSFAQNYFNARFPETLAGLLNRNLPELFNSVDSFTELMAKYASLKKATPAAASLFNEVMELSLNYWGVSSKSFGAINQLLSIIDFVYQQDSFSSSNLWLHQFEEKVSVLKLDDFIKHYLSP